MTDYRRNFLAGGQLLRHRQSGGARRWVSQRAQPILRATRASPHPFCGSWFKPICRYWKKPAALNSPEKKIESTADIWTGGGPAAFSGVVGIVPRIVRSLSSGERSLDPLAPGGVSSRFETPPDFLSMASKIFPQGSGEVEAVQVHHPGPRRHEVLHKLLLRVRARIDLREGAHLRMRTEDEVDTRAGPLDLVGLPVASFKHVFGSGRRLPLRAHVEQG